VRARTAYGWSRVLSCLTLASFLASASPALAQDAVTADALFREGRAALAREAYGEAAERFAESERLQPTPGAKLNLAIAESRLGKLASASEHARAARDGLSPTDERYAVAQTLFESLDKRVPRITLRVSPSLPQGGRIVLDDIELRAGSLGVPLPQNVGPHAIIVTAPEREIRRVNVLLREGDREVIELTVGTALPSRTPAIQGAFAARPTASSTSLLRPLGITGTVAGGIALVTAGVFAGLTLGRNGVVSNPDNCDARGCNDVGLDAARDGRAYATVSTISLTTGVVLLATGIALWVLAPSTPTAAPRVR
jgi:hypothetical protein